MIDHYNRTIDYIRISVTDQCNLNCIYCKPKLCSSKSHPPLGDDEILKLCRCFAQLGISKIKITGGEPLLRPGLDALIKKIKQIRGIETITLTTNGILLEKKLPALVKAGLDAVNISIDALGEDCYTRISGKNSLASVKKGIETALSFPGLIVKLNCVPLKGINDDQLVSIAGLAKDHPLHVRFIEMMPIGYGKQYAGRKEEELLRLLEMAFGKRPLPYDMKNNRLGNGPGHYYEIPGFQGKIGFISAISHKFCADCNRIRLSSTGYLKACLQYHTGCDLSLLLNAGASQEQITAAIRQVIDEKPMCHHFGETAPEKEEQTEHRKMFEIGG